MRIIRLEENYRSFGNILSAANAVISNNSQRMEKKMWTKAAAGPKLGWIQSANQWDIAREIQNKHNITFFRPRYKFPEQHR